MNIFEFKEYVDSATASEPNHVSPALESATSYRDVYGAIERLIGGGKDLLKELWEIKKELAIRRAAYDDALEPYLWIVSTIIDAVKNDIPAVLSKDWHAAISFMVLNKEKLSYATHGEDITQRLARRYLEVGHSIKLLRSEGFEVEVAQGKIKYDQGLMQRLAEKFDERATEIGGANLLGMIFDEISRAHPFCNVSKRFHLVRRISSSGDNLGGAQVPWAFMVQLAMKHVSVQQQYPSREKFNRLKGLATAAISMFDIQSYSPWEGMWVGHEDLIEHMRDNIFYDSFFTLTQMNGDHAQLIYKGIFTSDQLSSLESNGVRLKTAIKIADELLDRSRLAEVVLLQPSEIASKIRSGVQKTVRWIDEVFAHPVSGPNQLLEFPPISTSTDSMFRPLLKLKSGAYLLLPRSVIAPSLLEAVIQLARRADKKIDDKMGLAVERFLQGQFSKHKIKFSTGKYDFRSSRGSEEKRQASDCDVVVESSKLIAFFECKNKVLTRSARSGDPLDILLDLTKSLVKSQLQAMRHEKFLREKSEIVLTDNLRGKSSVFLGDRNVDRISVSLHDFNSLTDPQFLRRYLEICSSSTFSSEDESVQKNLDKINLEVQELRVLAEELGEFEGEQPIPFHSSTFLSVPNILMLLERANDNERFMKEVRANRSITFSSKDFYFEYATWTNMQNSARAKPELQLE